ncbi:MAG: hypothetical protein R3A10_02650 [Caldilineaceae bacterium]
MWNPFNSLLGAVRITGAVLVMVLGAVLIFFTTLIPFKVQGARASLWVVVYCARLFNLMFNVRVNCGSAPAIRQHHGFIFMNHLSFLEPLAVLSTTPVRFLAAAEVRRRPVSGWMAEQIGTVFVNATTRSHAPPRAIPSPRSSPAPSTRRWWSFPKAAWAWATV